MRDAVERVVPELRLCRAVFGSYTVLAEQGIEPLDLAAELLARFGQRWQARVFSSPLFLAGGLASKQFVFPVPQRCRPLIILVTDGRLLLAADPSYLLIQVTVSGPVAPRRGPLLTVEMQFQYGSRRALRRLTRSRARGALPRLPVESPARLPSLP
jgi:hypothetical protein